MSQSDSPPPSLDELRALTEILRVERNLAENPSEDCTTWPIAQLEQAIAELSALLQRAEEAEALREALERLATMQLWDDSDGAAENATREVREIARAALAAHRGAEGERPS
jgi:hypothetical protein